MMFLSRRGWLPWSGLALVVAVGACASPGAGPSYTAADSGTPVRASDGGADTAAAPVADDTRPPVGASMAGRVITDVSEHVPGSCAGRSVAEVIAAAHVLAPTLADITTVHGADPNLGGDGNFVYVRTTDDSIALAFKRGEDDCPSGCLTNEYWYFATDASCAPVAVGHYRAAWTAGNCLMVEGVPMWDLPKPIAPAYVCGADNGAQNISGTYAMRATGKRQPCTALQEDEPRTAVDLRVSLEVKQDPADLAHGSLTLTGTGESRLDGRSIPATFMRRQAAAQQETSNLPAACIDQETITLSLDLEGGSTGKLSYFEVHSLNCPPATDYCKGSLDLILNGIP